MPAKDFSICPGDKIKANRVGPGTTKEIEVKEILHLKYIPTIGFWYLAVSDINDDKFVTSEEILNGEKRRF